MLVVVVERRLARSYGAGMANISTKTEARKRVREAQTQGE